MNKQLEKAYKEIGNAFQKHLKYSEIGAFFMAVAEDGTLAVSFNGTEEQKYTVMAHFLFEHPEHIELFQTAIDCATNFHAEKQTSTSTKQFLN
jgi:hypothetical protein